MENEKMRWRSCGPPSGEIPGGSVMQPNSIPNVPWGLVQVVVQIPFFGPTIPNQGLVFNGADKSAILGTDVP